MLGGPPAGAGVIFESARSYPLDQRSCPTIGAKGLVYLQTRNCAVTRESGLGQELFDDRHHDLGAVHQEEMTGFGDDVQF
jgi:hypothetical protein